MAITHRKIGIIGAGRVGTSLALSSFPNGDVVAVSSRRAAQRDWLLRTAPKLKVVEKATEVAMLSDLVFITTSDAAIKPVCDGIDWQPYHHVVHCSGVLPLNVLASAKEAGAAVAGFHPLQTFPTNDSHRLLNISYAIDCEDEDLADWLWDLTRAYESEGFAIEGGPAHAAYHASAVLACGLLGGLVGISAELWRFAGIEREDALKMLSPMLRSTVDAIAEDGLPDAISGPYVRGDIETIRTHLEVTSEVNPDISRAYAALALAQLHIANEKGNLDQLTVDQIVKLLSDHLETL